MRNNLTLSEQFGVLHIFVSIKASNPVVSLKINLNTEFELAVHMHFTFLCSLVRLKINFNLRCMQDQTSIYFALQVIKDQYDKI